MFVHLQNGGGGVCFTDNLRRWHTNHWTGQNSPWTTQGKAHGVFLDDGSGRSFSHLRKVNNTRPEQADNPHQPKGLHTLHAGSVQDEGLQRGTHTKNGC